MIGVGVGAIRCKDYSTAAGWSIPLLLGAGAALYSIPPINRQHYFMNTTFIVVLVAVNLGVSQG